MKMNRVNKPVLSVSIAATIIIFVRRKEDEERGLAGGHAQAATAASSSDERRLQALPSSGSFIGVSFLLSCWPGGRDRKRGHRL
jgi:hypothetical protein